jgi:thioredoxin 2
MSARSDATIIRCPQCHERNRVRPAAQGIPRCANCHRPLPWVLSTNSEGYDAEITASVPVLVDFRAPGAGPAACSPPSSSALPPVTPAR